MSGSKQKNIAVTQSVNTSPANKPAANFPIPSWAPIAVMICTALLYSHALPNQLTSFDDDFYIVRNPFLKDFSLEAVKAIFSSFYSSNYHPLTTLTFLFEYHWFGTDPFSYHLINVVLHVLNTWLVYKLAEQLSGKRLTALIVSVLFAVHPMHVESVAWASERKDVLYTFFYLLSTLAYLRFMEHGKRSKDYLLCLLLFVASLMSKSTAVSLPVLFIVIDLYKDRKLSIRSLAEKTPFFLLSVLFGVLNIMAQSAGGSINNIAATLGFVNRIFLFTSAISAYLLRLVVPYKLAGMHYFPVLTNGFLPFEYYLSLPFIVIIVWLIIRRSAWRKELVFGSLFFFVSIFLMLQVVSVGSALTAERYTYVPYIGLFYIFGQWVSSIEAVQFRKIVLGLFSVVSIAYSAVTWDRIGIWKNDILLFSDIIEKYPNVYFGYWMMGNFEKVGGNLQSALQNYNKSLELDSTFDDSYYNRAAVLDAMGNNRAAIADYSKCIRINPKSADAYNNRGWDHFISGDTVLALQDIDSAIRLKPDYYEAYNNRGWIYTLSGRSNEAMSDFDQSLTINAKFSKARFNRAALKGTMHDYKGALADYDAIIALYPDDNRAYYYRAITHLHLSDTGAGCRDLQKARQGGNMDAAAMAERICH